MLPIRIAPLLAFAALSAAPLRAQTTWVVDDDGGPGVDFTSVVAAENAAVHGDVILVHPGVYADDVVTGKGLSFVAVPAPIPARLTGVTTVRDLPRTREVRFVGLRFAHVVLEDSRGPVVLTDVEVRETFGASNGMQVRRCANVRVSKSTITGHHPMPGLDVRTARMELTSCVVFGGRGPNGDAGEPGVRGAPGIEVADRAILSVAESVVSGGDGGWHGVGALFGGFGGTGMVIHPTARVFVSLGGPNEASIYGGDGGLGQDADYDGGGGNGVRNDGWLSFSNTYSLEGDWYADNPQGNAYSGSGQVESVTPHRPTLGLEGNLPPGSGTVKIQGEPGDGVELLVGDDVRVVTWTGAQPSLLLTVDRRIALGTIPASGELVVPFVAPATAQSGDLVTLQALVSTVNGGRLTNSAPIVLR